MEAGGLRRTEPRRCLWLQSPGRCPGDAGAGAHGVGRGARGTEALMVGGWGDRQGWAGGIREGGGSAESLREGRGRSPQRSAKGQRCM